MESSKYDLDSGWEIHSLIHSPDSVIHLPLYGNESLVVNILV